MQDQSPPTAEQTITRLDSPMDAMYLIHQGLRAQAAKVEEMVRSYQPGDSVQPIRCEFNIWTSALVFHALQEDEHMTSPMTGFQPARDNENEHRTLEGLAGEFNDCLETGSHDGLAERVKDALVALQEEQHTHLLERLEDVMAVLNDEIGKSRVVARTQRHLFGRVVALRIAQDDHLECEEEFVLPELRDRLDEAQELALMKRLLVDEEAEDRRWVLDWLSGQLCPAERELLADLEPRLELQLAGVSGD